MADILWDIATSYAVISFVAFVSVGLFVVGHLPVPSSPYAVPARFGAIVAAALLFFLLGFRVADKRAEAAQLTAQLRAKQVDLDAATTAKTLAEKAKDDATVRAEADEKRIGDYEDELRKRTAAAGPTCSCANTDADLWWLRDNKAHRR